MKLIRDCAELEKLTGILRKEARYGNFVMNRERIVSNIERGTLYLEEEGENLYILEEEAAFFRLFYFLKDLSEPVRLMPDKTMVVEFPYRENYTERDRRQTDFLLKSGFELARQSSMMELRSSDVCKISCPKIDGLRIGNGIRKEADEYEEMLESSFNPLFAFLPGRKEINAIIEEKRLFVAYRDSIPAAIMNIELERNVVWTNHIVVRKAYRGLGIGRAIHQYVHELYADRCGFFRCWVDIHNTPSVKMHERAGYRISSRKADEYIHSIDGSDINTEK
ncbi:MAG: GNAT family N-acetyltransferase [Lachnospiraceae bacterium]|nr:GNAT family N-acetyltransferase [Lachnospiraceae bacterium]